MPLYHDVPTPFAAALPHLFTSEATRNRRLQRVELYGVAGILWLPEKPRSYLITHSQCPFPKVGHNPFADCPVSTLSKDSPNYSKYHAGPVQLRRPKEK